jgi:hypothetical protein
MVARDNINKTETLIEIIRNYPILYDLSHEHLVRFISLRCGVKYPLDSVTNFAANPRGKIRVDMGHPIIDYGITRIVYLLVCILESRGSITISFEVDPFKIFLSYI